MADNQVPFDQLKVPANKYGTDGSALPQYQRDFIARFSPYAMLAAAQSGLPARFLLAEASIETDWGRSGSATRGNNMFGIKATPSQIAAGVPVEYLPTTEYRSDGTRYTETSPFIKYKTAEDGFNGFVDKLQRTRWPDQKALLNYRSATPYAQDDATEKALSDAFGRTSYLTMPGINQTMIDRMARFPANLEKAGFKTAVDFNKASNDLAGLVSYNDGAGYPDVSAAADNDGLGTFSLNGVTFNRTPAERGPLDQFSDGITRGLETAGRGAADLFSGGADAIGRGLSGLFGGGTADAATYPPLTLPAEGTDGFGNPAYGGPGDALGYGNNSFGQGVTPFGDVSPLAFAGGRNFAGNTGLGIFGSGLNGSGISPNAPTDYGFAGSFAPGMAGQLPAGFDPRAYLAANGDVAASGMDPATHYLSFGRQEGRALSPDAWAQTLGPPAGTPTFGPTGTPTTGAGSTAPTYGAPQAFNASNYLAANADLQALGFSPERAAQHFQEFGQFEARALGPGQEARVYSAPGATATFGPAGTASTVGNPFSVPTLGSGSTASTIGPPAASNALPAFFSPRDYVAANADLAGMSDQQAIDHFQTFGRNEVRALAPWLQASVYGAPAGTSTFGPPGLSPIYQPPQPTQTFGPGGSIDVMSSGLVPTQLPPDLTSTFGPGPTITARTGTFNGDEYLRANADVAASGQSALDHFRNYGYREGRAIDTLGNHFNGDAYLAANRDVAMAGLNPLEHFLRYGAQEARTLAPTDWASPLTATTNAGTYGAPAATQTLGPGGMTSTYGAPDPTLTIGPPALTGTYGPPATTPTIGAGNPVPSWSPFGGAGIGSPFGFSGANVGGGLGAGPQSFGSLWPVGSGVSEPAPAADPGSAGLGPFDFTNANVGGFDVNALGGGGAPGGGPSGVNEMGISGGFDSEGAMRRVLEQQAADLRKADQAAKTVMHSDPNAFNVAIANGGNTVGMGTALQTPGAIGGPVVPNLTVRNYATSAPGAMFSMFAPWR